tara:strand:- start:1829 stop:2056 length:228 start_codon:yes stop_codon:yes gene_type:complete
VVLVRIGFDPITQRFSEKLRRVSRRKALLNTYNFLRRNKSILINTRDYFFLRNTIKQKSLQILKLEGIFNSVKLD